MQSNSFELLSTGDDEKEIDITQPPRTNPISRKLPSKYWVLRLLLATLSFCVVQLNVASLLSCNENSIYGCTPQFLVQTYEDSKFSNLCISMIQDALSLVSFVATDFTGDSMDNDLKVAIIDTLSSENIFNVNFNGYCRFNYGTKLQKCHKSHLEIISCWTLDVGLQLGAVSNRSEIVGESFVSTYGTVLRSLNDLYILGQKEEEDNSSQVLDMSTLQMIRMLNITDLFTKILSSISKISVHLSFLVMIYSILLFIKPIQTIILQLLIFCDILLCLQIILNSVMWISVLIYINKFEQIFNRFDFATIKLSTGFILTILNAIILFILVLLTIKLHQEKSKRHPHN